jgi:hypothetical protein
MFNTERHLDENGKGILEKMESRKGNLNKLLVNPRPTRSFLSFHCAPRNEWAILLPGQSGLLRTS